MKTKKIVISLIALVGLCSCGGKTTPTSESSNITEDSSITAAFAAKLSRKEIEVGNTATVVSNYATNASDTTVNFTTENTDIISITRSENGRTATVTGLKAGSATILLTSNAKPSVFTTLTITVIDQLPSLSQVVKNIASLDSYVIISGDYYYEQNFIAQDTVTVVNENSILSVDTTGSAYVSEGSVNYYGEVVPSDSDYAVYVTSTGSKFTTQGEAIRSNTGLLTKDTFKGRGEDAISFDEVGEFYGIEAFNPNWFSSLEKNEDNYYELVGDKDSSTLLSKNINYAFTEALVYKLADRDEYEETVTDEIPSVTDIASEFETYATVLASNAVMFYIYLDGAYSAALFAPSDSELVEEYETDIDSLNSSLSSAVSNVTYKENTLNSDLQAAKTAILTNNYVQKNSLYPDHETECQFYTYYTPNYVFYDCNKEFVEKYNPLAEEEDKWTDSPYGYIKKSDGIYKFTYDETADSVTVNSTKEEKTDANTKLNEFANYFSAVDFVTSDLIYAFEDEEATIWDGESTKYHKTTSRDILSQILNYYAPEDIPELDYDKALSGLGVEFSNGAVSQINVSAGFAPFIDNNVVTKETSYGVNRFALEQFSQATTNKVDSKLNA